MVQEHFLQLNSISTSTLTALQMSNFLCKPSTEADNSSKSSAYIITPTKIELIVQHLLHDFKLVMKILMKTVNSAGEKELPWRTPLCTLNSRERADFHLTATRSFPYQSVTNKITQ